MNRTNLKAFSTAIAAAALSRKTALQLEIAVCFAVNLECAQAKRLTRALLCEIYAGAGYKCSTPADLDWKSINRRITAGLALFEFFGVAEITNWVEGKQRKELLDAIVAKLEPLKIKSTNEILAICDKAPAKPRGPRAEPAGTHHVKTEHIHITIPPEATRAELLDAALAMMKLAEQMAADTLADEAATAAEHAQEHEQPEPVAA